jgi:hypothetical protein
VSAYTLNTIGWVRFATGQDGSADIQRSIEFAREHRREEQAARGYANLYQAAVDHMRIVEFDWCFSEGMAYCHDSDLRTYTVCLRGSRATALLRTGRLAEAETLVEAALRETISPVNRLHLLIPFAIACGRRGDPRASGLIDEAWQLAAQVDQRYWLLQLSAGLAETAWVHGDARSLDDRVLTVYGRPVDEDYPWLLGELTTWLARVGLPVRTVAGLPDPFRLELAGEHKPPPSGGTRPAARSRRPPRWRARASPTPCYTGWTCSPRSARRRRRRWSGRCCGSLVTWRSPAARCLRPGRIRAA